MNTTEPNEMQVSGGQVTQSRKERGLVGAGGRGDGEGVGGEDLFKVGVSKQYQKRTSASSEIQSTMLKQSIEIPQCLDETPAEKQRKYHGIYRDTRRETTDMPQNLENLLTYPLLPRLPSGCVAPSYPRPGSS